MTVDHEPERRRGVQIDLAGLLQRHTAVFISLVPIVIVVLRIVRVSDFETTTARGILESLGLVQVIAGTLLPLVPTVLFVGALALSVYAFREHTAMARVSRFVAPVVALFCVVLFPWGILVLLLAGSVVVLAIQRPIARHRSKRLLESFDLNWFIGAGVLLVVAQLFVYGTMWLPAERIYRQDAEPTIGYVLKSEFVWTTVLVEPNRTIRRFRTDSIRRRVVCQLGDADIDGEASLLDLLRDQRRQSYPRC